MNIIFEKNHTVNTDENFKEARRAYMYYELFNSGFMGRKGLYIITTVHPFQCSLTSFLASIP
jgi:hypothetical protein